MACRHQILARFQFEHGRLPAMRIDWMTVEFVTKRLYEASATRLSSSE